MRLLLMVTCSCVLVTERAGSLMSRFEQYSNEARKALAQAREDALRLNHKTICTEHLLLGLLEINDPLIESVINNLGASSARMRQALEFVIEIGRASCRERV